MLRRLYGEAWDEAPGGLRLSVAAVVLGGVAGLLLTGVSLALDPVGSIGLAVAGLLFVGLLVAIAIALCALLLRGSRVVWSLLVLLHALSLSAVPRSLLEALGTALTALTLAALLTPGAVRAVWGRRPGGLPAGPDLRRPD